MWSCKSEGSQVCKSLGLMVMIRKSDWALRKTANWNKDKDDKLGC